MIRTIDLSLPAITTEDDLYHSGVQWLYGDGHMCRANEIIGFFNVTLVSKGLSRQAARPFASEHELQIAFAPKQAGRLRLKEGRALGGHLNTEGVHIWNPQTVMARLEVSSGASDFDEAEAGGLRLLMLAGQRMTDIANMSNGLLPGWHSHTRGWWGEGEGAFTTLLSLGICDATGVIRGDRSAFTEMFEAERGRTQMVSVPDHPMVPCAPVLLEQITRTPAQFEAIAKDALAAIAGGGVDANPKDWLFMGGLLNALEHRPMSDTFDLLTQTGLTRSQPAQWVALSLNAEGPSILRHKALGYHVHMLRHHRQAAGPAARNWLNTAFEPVKRTIADIKQDYAQLFATAAKAHGTRFMILNRMSTSGHEDITSYAPFDAPLSDTLANIASKELNLMLHELAEDTSLAIVDVDAIAADLGGGVHLPDGIHQSGRMQAEVRQEILSIIHED